MRTLRDDSVYLFRAKVDAPPLPEVALDAFLSLGERERCRRFRFDPDRRRFTVATGWMRWVLGRLTDRDPSHLQFEYSQFGKPQLPLGPCFNLTHSGEHVLLAVAKEGRVGADIEVVRDISDLEGLASRIFFGEEMTCFREFPAEERKEAFFRGWTRKEALLKALGGGLSIPLQSVSVDLRRGFSEVRLRFKDSRESPGGWSVRSVPGAPGVAAAVAWDRGKMEVEEGTQLLG